MQPVHTNSFLYVRRTCPNSTWVWAQSKCPTSPTAYGAFLFGCPNPLQLLIYKIILLNFAIMLPFFSIFNFTEIHHYRANQKSWQVLLFLHQSLPLPNLIHCRKMATLYFYWLWSLSSCPHSLSYCCISIH